MEYNVSRSRGKQVKRHISLPQPDLHQGRVARDQLSIGNLGYLLPNETQLLCYAAHDSGESPRAGWELGQLPLDGI